MFTPKTCRLIPFNALQNTKRLLINAGIARGFSGCLRKTRLRNVTSYRSFATSSNLRMADQPLESNEAGSKTQGSSASESEKWISILENTTSAPWLFSSKPGLEEKLMLAHTLLFQIVLYLCRPEGAEEFLTAFGTAPAPPGSEMGRARVAVPVILRAAVHHISTIPLNSPLRRAHLEIFEMCDTLQAIHDTYLTNTISDLETWTAFWSRAQPVVIELGMKLDEKGFRLPEDEVEKELKESK